MKLIALITLSFTTLLFAADPPIPDSNAREIKKLGAVTWKPDVHKLVWVIQKGTLVDGEFVPSSEEQYELSPEEAMMALGKEHRGIDSDEAVSLHRLLDTLALYCAQSVAWWNDGKGKPLEPTSKPEAPAKPVSDPSVVRVAMLQKPCGTALNLHAQTTPGTSVRSWL